MASLINDLTEILQELDEVYSGLLALGAEKKENIIKDDLENLKRINLEESSLLGRGQRIDRKRIALVHDIAYVLAVPVENLTMTALAEKIKGQGEHEPFVVVNKKLKATLEELEKMNHVNRALIEHAIDYVDYTFNAIQSTFGNEYASYPNQNEDTGKSFYDIKN